MAGAFKKSDLEILLSTMNRTSLDFLMPMFPSGSFQDYNILIINQTTQREQLISEFGNIRVINNFDKGLSKSRNLALQNASAAVCIIADDDIIFKPGFDTAVLKAFNDNVQAALIIFRAENGAGMPYRKYPPVRKTSTTTVDRLLILSVEMVVNKALVHKLNIQFDEQFGLGAAFAMGEEAIFAHDLNSAGGSIVLEPYTIVSHPQPDTSAKISVREKYYIQGAFFSRLFGNAWLIWVLRKLAYELKNNKISIADGMSALRFAYRGRKAFVKNEQNIS